MVTFNYLGAAMIVDIFFCGERCGRCEIWFLARVELPIVVVKARADWVGLIENIFGQTYSFNSRPGSSDSRRKICVGQRKASGLSKIFEKRCAPAVLTQLGTVSAAPPPKRTPFSRHHAGGPQTWLILPAVICLSQRLSHACLSVSFNSAEL